MFKEENLTKNNEVKNNNLEVLKQNFSNCFDKNGDFDFDKFKKEISENEIDFSKESYGMDWLGKSYARVLASDPARTLLKEDKNWNKKEENKNSENVLIKGDNLEVLKHLSNAYHEQVKMIYIDPPYNTGSDGFVYQDDRKFTVKEFSKLAGVEEEKSKNILDFVDSKSNSHSAWLTFMYPRLYIAKQLLKDDGVIFVSIDENEVSQLKILMDEIFGEENSIAIAPRKTGAGSAATRGDSELRKLNDYVLIYMKSKFIFQKKVVGQREFPFEDKKGKYYLGQFQASGSDATRSARPNMYYSIYFSKDNRFSSIKLTDNDIVFYPDLVNGEEGRWLWSKEKLDLDYELLFNDNGKIKRKIYFDDSKDNTVYQVEKAYLEGFTNSSGTNEVNALFSPIKKIFSNPKPTKLIKHLIKLIYNETTDYIVLDFFGGSGTTGDSVIQLNSEDGGNRKYIMFQLPEEIDKKKNKVAYDFVKYELGVEEPTIFDITKERLIRAGKKIKKDVEESGDEKKIKKLSNLDFGFKVFETSPIWEDYNVESEVFNENLKLFDETKLSSEDLETLLTTWKTADNISLTRDLEKIDLDGYIAHYFEDKIYLMNKGFETKKLKELLEKIDGDKTFEPKTIIAFGYHFESKNLREIAENIKAYSNKKNIDIDFIARY